MRKIRKKIIKLLLWSQKHTKADMLYLAKGSFWIGFSQVMNGIFSFGLIIAFANLLPKETYGMYTYILSLASILNIFTLTGMNNAVSRSVARGNEGILIPAVKYQLKWNLLMLGASFLLAGYYFINNETILAYSILILGLFVPFTLAFGTYGSYLEGKKQFAIANILSVISTFVYSMGMLITILLGDKVILLIGTYAITTLLSSFVFYIYTLRKFNHTESNDIEETLKYGRTLTYIKLLGPIVSQIDKIVLAHFWGTAQLATYAIASIIPNKGVPALKKLVNIGFPKFVAKTPEKINTVFYKRIFQGMLVGATIAVLCILLLPFLFKYLLPQYVDGVFYSQILAINFVFALPTRYIGLLFESQKMSSQIFINTMINSLLAILLYIILGIWGGIMGIVIAYVLWSFIGMLVNLISWKISSRTK